MASTTVHYTPAHNVTIKASADIKAGTFVAISGELDGRNPVAAPAAAGARVFGVVAHDVAQGDYVMVYRVGYIVDVAAQGAINPGDIVAAAAGGKAIKAADGATPVGVAVSKAANGIVTVAL